MKFLLLPLLMLQALWCVAQESSLPVLPADASPAGYMPLLRHKRVAIVANQTSRVRDSLLVDMLLARGVEVVRIMAPEHGFRGREDAGASIGNSTDSVTGLPVVSLYGAHVKPRPADLADIDIVVYDLQDVGARFYTYISTLQYVMEACAENHRKLVVLDRPNPNGFYVDGPVLEPQNKSFVGMQPVPVVYGMTAGEYARMLIGERWINGAETLDLQVIPCINYDHGKKYRLPVAPSPNLRDMAAVYAYPSLCLFEGTAVSVGRGTDLPFRQYGSPAFQGVYTYSFTPESMNGAQHPPCEGKVCYGALVAGSEAAILDSIDSGLRLSWLIRAYNSYPDKDKFFSPFFVKLCGAAKLQVQIKNGEGEEEIRRSWQSDLAKFKKIRKKYLLY